MKLRKMKPLVRRRYRQLVAWSKISKVSRFYVSEIVDSFFRPSPLLERLRGKERVNGNG